MKNKKKKTINYYFKIISQIEKVRKNNNKNWMDILRTSFTYAPIKTAKIMSKIYSDDSRISKLAKRLAK
jgi:vacuolar-type H+-ATPase subunit D/Vma8